MQVTHYTHDEFFADEPRRHTSNHLVRVIRVRYLLPNA